MLRIRYERRRDYITESALGLEVLCKAGHKADAANAINLRMEFTEKPFSDKNTYFLPVFAAL